MAAFYEGYPNGTLASNISAAAWMVEQVRAYPGEVVIYSGGALTNIALAVRLDPQFASLAKGLVIMGGYLDVNLLTTSGSVLQADLNSDVSLRLHALSMDDDLTTVLTSRKQINLKIDPEGAKIALTADFPSISTYRSGLPSLDTSLTKCSHCG